jgi:hypothetical protein
MIIRGIKETDINELRRIHARFYADEFTFPDFMNRFINPVVVEDEGKIITAGGVVPIAESIILTNKDIDYSTRLFALKHLLDDNLLNAQYYGFKRLYAFARDSTWEKYLIKAGFEKNEILSIGVV